MKHKLGMLVLALLCATGLAAQSYNFEATQQNIYDWTPLFTMSQAGILTLNVSSTAPEAGCAYSPTEMVWALNYGGGPSDAVQLTNGASSWTSAMEYALPAGTVVGVEGSGGIGDCRLPLDVAVSVAPVNDQANATPEPGSIMLLGSGVLLLAAVWRRRG